MTILVHIVTFGTFFPEMVLCSMKNLAALLFYLEQVPLTTNLLIAVCDLSKNYVKVLISVQCYIFVFIEES
jgi:hypothetical protein